MMFFPVKDETAPARFKFPWVNKTSLSTKLLADAPTEIELSDYQRLPSSASESPSRLLQSEGLKAEPIADLDIFFERLYEYFCAKGLWCITVKWMIEILHVSFMVCCIGFFFLLLDWNALRHLKCGVEALESGEKPCDLWKLIKHHPLVPFTFTKMIIIGSMVILTSYGLFNFLKFFVQLNNTLKVRDFYYNRLHVTDREIQTTSWPRLLDKVVQLQKSQKLCVVRDLSEHDILMRIMRKENYLIGMVNKGVLAFRVPHWFPGVGPVVSSRAQGAKSYLILPKPLEWTLNWCIFQSMFDRNFCVRKDFLTSPSVLKRRLLFVGILMLFLSPCLVIFPLVYLFLRHAEEFYNHPSTASSRRWSNLSRWILREFNEVEHFFKHRMNNSAVNALNYLKQFPTPLISIIAKFISFVSGGLAGILIIIGFLGESTLEGHVFGRNLFWYTIVLGTIAAISRQVVADELQVIDPEGAMSVVVQQTHYRPKRWRGKENSELVRREFETLYQYTIVMLLEEMASILITPYLLIFVVPKRVEDILCFISDFTVYVGGVGDVCSLSLFDFERHGNRNYASPFNAAKSMRSSQGKMEKSFLSFQTIYESWEPNEYGKVFLSNLQKFKERRMCLQTHAGYQAIDVSRLVSSTRGQSGDNRLLARNVLNEGIRSAGYDFGSLGLLDCDKKTHPYILDWYYTCHASHSVKKFEDSSPTPPDEASSEPAEDTWQLLSQPLADRDEDGNWDSHLSERVKSHFEASTSSAFFQEKEFNNGESEHTTNHWWARPRPHSIGVQASFMEPPDFGHQRMVDHQFSHHSDDISEGGVEDIEESNSRSKSNWRSRNSMSGTMYMDDDSDKEEGLSLRFAENTQRSEEDHWMADNLGPPLVSLPVRIIPRSSDPV